MSSPVTPAAVVAPASATVVEYYEFKSWFGFLRLATKLTGFAAFIGFFFVSYAETSEYYLLYMLAFSGVEAISILLALTVLRQEGIGRDYEAIFYVADLTIQIVGVNQAMVAYQETQGVDLEETEDDFSQLFADLSAHLHRGQRNESS